MRGNQLDVANADIAHDLANPAQPRSTIGWLVEGTAAAARGRRAAVRGVELRQPAGQRQGAAPRAGGFRAGSAMPISRNGSRAEVVCPRTMVDSITPATDDALRKRARP